MQSFDIATVVRELIERMTAVEQRLDQIEQAQTSNAPPAPPAPKRAPKPQL